MHIMYTALRAKAFDFAARCRRNAKHGETYAVERQGGFYVVVKREGALAK